MEALFRRFQGHVIRRDIEDTMVLWVLKTDKFIVKSLYASLTSCRVKIMVFIRCRVKPLGSNEN